MAEGAEEVIDLLKVVPSLCIHKLECIVLYILYFEYGKSKKDNVELQRRENREGILNLFSHVVRFPLGVLVLMSMRYHF